ncbi:MAG TPA: SRPBCC family protein [Actinomycetota bacterium]|nr:SRPBCC family protein [Actinomycetota bacterium]
MRQRGATAVQAPPEAIFEALERDRTGLNNDDLGRNDPDCGVPYGLGYRFVTRQFHGGHICSTRNEVTVFDAPRLVVEQWEQECPARGKTVSGTLRFEVIVDRGGTTLVRDITTRSRGFAPMEALAGALCNRGRLLAKQIGMRAEALTLWTSPA